MADKPNRLRLCWKKQGEIKFSKLGPGKPKNLESLRGIRDFGNRAYGKGTHWIEDERGVIIE